LSCVGRPFVFPEEYGVLVSRFLAPYFLRIITCISGDGEPAWQTITGESASLDTSRREVHSLPLWTEGAWRREQEGYAPHGRSFGLNTGACTLKHGWGQSDIRPSCPTKKIRPYHGVEFLRQSLRIYGPVRQLAGWSSASQAHPADRVPAV